MAMLLLLALVVRLCTRNRTRPFAKGGLLFTFCPATRVRVLQTFAVRSPESELQKMPGARRRSLSAGQWNDGEGSCPPAARCGPLTLRTRTARPALKQFRHTIDSSVGVFVMFNSHCLSATT